MKAIDVIRTALTMSEQATLQLIDDMRDAALTQPTSKGGNHPLWLLGHITFIEGNVPRTIFGEKNAVEHWAPLFAPGTQPNADASTYPPFDEIRRTFTELRARNMKILNELGEEGLDR